MMRLASQGIFAAQYPDHQISKVIAGIARQIMVQTFYLFTKPFCPTFLNSDRPFFGSPKVCKTPKNLRID
ncbi:MAG: hypothetical protein AAFO95_09845 [Cyanobacteria bacterium J06600_6]